MKGKDLRKLTSNETDELKTCEDTKKRWCDDDEPCPVVYKVVNYKETTSCIDTKDDITYGTGIVECDCKQHKDFVNENHGHVLTGEFRLIRNSKQRKLVSKKFQLSYSNANKMQ